MLTGEPFKLIELRRTAHQRAKIQDNVFAAVSPEDYGWIKEHTWTLNISGIKRLYAYTINKSNGKYQYMGMARMILKRAGPLAENEIAEHQNGYTLDNRRSNLTAAKSRR